MKEGRGGKEDEKVSFGNRVTQSHRRGDVAWPSRIWQVVEAAV